MRGSNIARPVPFALLTGNVYELQDAGISQGNAGAGLCAAYAVRRSGTGDEAYDDGWFGYGTFRAPSGCEEDGHAAASYEDYFGDYKLYVGLEQAASYEQERGCCDDFGWQRRQDGW